MSTGRNPWPILNHDKGIYLDYYACFGWGKFYYEFKPNCLVKRICSCAQKNQALPLPPPLVMGTRASTAFKRGYKYLAPLTTSTLPKMWELGLIQGMLECC